MAYIIENANVLKESGLKQLSLLIKDERIHSIRPSFKKFSYMRLNAESYVMTPSHIIYCPEIPVDTSFPNMKQFFIDTFIVRGCTMFLTNTTIEKEHLLKKSLQQIKRNLLNSPIDFTVGVRISPSLLTPNFIRKCKKEKIPAIFVEIDSKSRLDLIPWGWIREAMFPYNSPLIPIFLDERERQRKSAQMRWTSIMNMEKIPSIEYELKAKEPISRTNLSKMGIYPKRLGIHQGGEVSYNFYLKADDRMEIEESKLFQEYLERLVVAVHRGKVIKAGANVFFRPGFGEHVIVDKPSFFYME